MQNEENKQVKKEVESLSIVDEAKKVRDEIRAENDRREKILADEQKLHAEKMLSGTGGGHIEVAPPKEETPKEYANRIMNNKVSVK